jgi:hypothetical protein
MQEPSFIRPAAAREWEAILQRIRAQIEHPVELGSSVTVVQTVRSSAVRGGSLVGELARRHGMDPVVVRTLHGVVASVDAPAWAEWIHTECWKGHPLISLGDVIGRNVGPTSSAAAATDLEGVDAVEVTVEVGGGARRLAVYAFLDESSSELWAVAFEDEVGPPPVRAPR